ncbi:MAG: hypothetical protein WCD44_02140 [Candidatus Babeliales bacterium]
MLSQLKKYCKLLQIALVLAINTSGLANTIQQKPEKEIWLTIFVHGIMSIRPHLNFSNFMNFMRDEIENTVYSKTVELMRKDKFFHLNQAMQEFGLEKINLSSVSKENATSITAFIYDEVTKLSGAPETTNHYYTFGWSGLLSPTVRYKEGKKLFNSIVKELNIFWEQNIYPKIRLIGYSHGGNVCLNLAAIRQDKYPLSSLTIDELILLGCPVQTETDYLVADQIFKKVYHIYSLADRIQRIDFFSFNRCFSRRHFQNRQHFKVPKNLTQIRFKVMRNKKTKSEKRRNKQQKLALNFSDPSIISGTSPLLRNMSPGHMELWFFGWTPGHYRDNFVLYPLPVLSFVPLLIHHIQQAESSLVNPHPITIDVRPEQEVLFIKQHKRNKFVQKFPFISKSDFNRLATAAFSHTPDNYTKETYQQHIKTSFQEAQRYVEKQKKIKKLASPRKKSKHKKSQQVAQNNMH